MEADGEDNSSDEETRDHLMEVDQDQDRKYPYLPSNRILKLIILHKRIGKIAELVTCALAHLSKC